MQEPQFCFRLEIVALAASMAVPTQPTKLLCVRKSPAITRCGVPVPFGCASNTEWTGSVLVMIASTGFTICDTCQSMTLLCRASSEFTAPKSFHEPSQTPYALC